MSNPFIVVIMNLSLLLCKTALAPPSPALIPPNNNMFKESEEIQKVKGSSNDNGTDDSETLTIKPYTCWFEQQCEYP